MSDYPKIRLAGKSKTEIQAAIDDLKIWFGIIKFRPVKVVNELPDDFGFCVDESIALDIITIDDLEAKIANNTIDEYVERLYQPYLKK